MVYGLVRDLCDQTELSVMRSKRIPMENIILVTQPNVLLARVHSGDVVWLVTVADFQSVTRFAELADWILRLGVQLRIVNEPYLEVGNGKHWRMSVRAHVETLMALEQENAMKLRSVFRFTDRQRMYADSCIADITVGILSKTYASDGILHRGG